MKGRGLIVICVFALFYSSCEFSNNLVIEMDREAFERERNAWLIQNLKNYHFT
jgi:hypothetical protein